MFVWNVKLVVEVSKKFLTLILSRAYSAWLKLVSTWLIDSSFEFNLG